MFLKTHNLLFLSCTILGTFITISSNNWFTAWIGLEINLLSVTPLILNNLDSNLSEAAIKYFLTQALASLFIIISSMTILSLSSVFSLENKNILLTMAILIKAGMIPFHYWFPQVIKLLKWTQCLMMITWQKIAPLFLISFLENKLMIMASLFSAMFGSIMGLNQNNLKILITYSSIAHSGWMALACIIKTSILIFYFLVYSLISLSIILILKTLKIFKINQIKTMNINIYLYTFAVNMLSLGGLPPLLGFLAKLSVIILVINLNMKLLFLVLIISSLISLFFYTRIIYSLILLKFFKKNIQFNMKSQVMNYFLYLSILANLTTPFLI